MHHGRLLGIFAAALCGPFQARVNSTPLGGLSQDAVDARVSAGITGKADNSDLSTLSGTVSTLSSTVSGKASTSAVNAALAQGPGVKISLDPTVITGTGSEQATALTIDSAITLTDGHKYEFNLIARANAHGGSQNKIAHVRFTGLTAQYNSSGPSWTVEDVGHVDIDPGVDANPFFLADFYAMAGSAWVASEMPAIDFNAGSVRISSNVLNSKQIDLEVDGVVIDHGTSGHA